MAEHRHRYCLTTTWTGNSGAGTSGYRAYSRNHEILVPGKDRALECSSDAAFRGDAARYSPEELLVASLSGCHMLWFLHLCADAGIVVTEYVDQAEGRMAEHKDGSGEFVAVTLHPNVTIHDAARLPEIVTMHDAAHRLCFIARSVNFPVTHEPVTRVAGA